MDISDIRAALCDVIPDELQAHWELSRSGVDPRFGGTPSDSRYLHVLGGNGSIKVRVSDHPNHRSVADFEIHDSFPDSKIEAIIGEFKLRCAQLTPFDPKAAAVKREAAWKAEVDAALTVHSIDSIVTNYKMDAALEARLPSVDSIQSEIKRYGLTLIDDGDDDEVIRVWWAAVVEQARLNLDADPDAVTYYNALMFTEEFGWNGKLFKERSSYGDADAKEEMKRRKWVIDYLRHEHTIVIEGTQYEIEEFLGGLLTNAIEGVCAEPDPPVIRTIVK
jgi:hypothetical protein